MVYPCSYQEKEDLKFIHPDEIQKGDLFLCYSKRCAFVERATSVYTTEDGHKRITTKSDTYLDGVLILPTDEWVYMVYIPVTEEKFNAIKQQVLVDAKTKMVMEALEQCRDLLDYNYKDVVKLDLKEIDDLYGCVRMIQEYIEEVLPE